MPDDLNGQNGRDAQNNTPTGETPANGDQEGRIEDLPVWAQKLLSKRNEEAASHRIALKKKEEETAAAEQARLAEQGKFKELAEAREKERDALKPYQQRAEALEKIISDNNAQMIARIPEDMRDIVPPLAADELNAWLVKNLPRLTRKPAPELDAGAGQGGGSKQPQVTPEIQSMASMARDFGFNISPEALAKRKAEMAQQRRRSPEKDEE